MRQTIALKGELDADSIRELVERRVARVRRRAKRFPSDGVHLHLLVRQHPSKPLARVALSLHLPSRTLATHEQAEIAEVALADAFDELERLLDKEKARLRGEHRWRGGGRALRERLAARQPPPPLELSDALAPLEPALPQLEAFARREIALREEAGELAPGEVEPDEIVDAALLRALEKESRPGATRVEAWLLRHGRDALEEALAQHRIEIESGISFDEAAPDGRESRDGAPGSSEVLDLYPPGADLLIEDVLPSLGAGNPEQLEATAELEHALRRMIALLPRCWRESFTLRVIDGLDWPEIAAVTDRAPDQLAREAELARSFLEAKLGDSGLVGMR